jgi:hypothetical protein
MNREEENAEIEVLFHKAKDEFALMKSNLLEFKVNFLIKILEKRKFLGRFCEK